MRSTLSVVCRIPSRPLFAGAIFSVFLAALVGADDPLVAPSSSVGYQAPNVAGASTDFHPSGTQGIAQAYQCVGKVDFGQLRVENQFGILVWNYTGIKWGSTTGTWLSPQSQFNQKVAFTDRGNGVLETVTAHDEGFHNEVLIQAPGGTGKITLTGTLTTQLAIERTFDGDSTATSFRTDGQVVLVSQQGLRCFAIDAVRAIDANGDIHNCNVDWVQVPGGFTFTIIIPNTWLSTAVYPIRVEPMIGVPSAVSPEGGSRDSESAVAYGGGQYFVVWTAGASTSLSTTLIAATTSNDVYARRVGADGTLLGPTFAVATGSASQRYARVAYASGAGGVFAVAHKDGNSVVLKRYNLAGVLLSTSTVNNPLLNNRVTTVDIASNGVDRFCIAWTGYLSTDTFRQTWAEVRDADGSVVADDTVVGSASGTQVHAGPTVVWNAALSQWFFVWTEYDSAILGSPRQIEARAFDATITTAAFPESVMSTALGSNYEARAGWSATSGEYLVAYTNNPPAGSTNVRGQRVSASDGSLIGGEFLVETSTKRSTAAAVEWVPAANRWLLGFELNGSGMRGTYGQALRADGSTVGPLFVLSDGTDFAEMQVALTRNPDADEYLSTWTDGTSTVQDIWGARLEVTPPVPPGPITTSNDSTSITLTWPKGTETDLRGYFIGKSTTPGGPYSFALGLILPPAGPTVTYVDTAVSVNTRYYYVVTAVDTHANPSDLSAEASEIIDTVPPAPPSGLTGTPSDLSAKLAWTPNSEVDLLGYNVYFRLSTDVPRTKANSSPVTSTSYTVTGLTNGLSYDFWITALDQDLNESGLSTMVSVIPSGDGVPPAPPTGLLAVSGPLEIEISWNMNSESDLDGYNLYYKAAASADWIKFNDALIETTTATAAGLEFFTSYDFKVTAVDEGGLESADSVTISATSGVSPAASAPGSVTATAGNKAVVLTWTASTGSLIIGYDVFRALASGDTFFKINPTTITGLTFTDAGLINGTTYYYRVAPVQGPPLGTNGHFSGIVSATPAFPPPTSLTLVSHTGTTATMSWVASTAPDVTGYDVHRSTTSGGSYTVVGSLPGTATSFVDIGLGEGTFYWVVTAKSASEESAYSNEISATLAGVEPPDPPDLFAENTRKTMDTTPKITGSTGAGFLVKVYEGATLLGSGFAGPDGKFTISTSELSEFDHFIQATAQESETTPVSGFSVMRIVTIDTTPPATPVGLSAFAGDGWVSLQWESNEEPDLLGYNVYRRTTGPADPWEKQNVKPLLNPRYLDSDVVNTTTYEYRVTAVDDAKPD